MPPLRLRDNDVVLLAEHFLELGNKTYNRNVLGFSDEVISLLKQYEFPGNIRELENIIINAVAKTKNQEYIETIDLPPDYVKKAEKKSSELIVTGLDEAIEEHILNVMKSVGNSIQRAAPILGVSERTLQRRLKAIREKN